MKDSTSDPSGAARESSAGRGGALPALIAVLALVAALVWAAPAAAQTQEQKSVVRPVRVTEPPQIDGRLDEPLWNAVEPISDFRQWEPDNGAPASERTEVRIVYDDEYLYVGVRAFDREAGRIVARQFERDARLDNDDAFTIELDSLSDNRTAFFFETNALGAQADGQITENGPISMQWDAIWYSAGNIDELGYTVEIAVPFFALRFQPADVVDMGIYLERIIRRKNERVSWPHLSRDHSYNSVSQFDRLEGLQGIRRGVGVEVKPYGIGGYSEVPSERGWDGDAGLDVKWGLTTSLTADFTVNPDFAQVESDALQVNLTRFSLFFPERREFFLESADLFTFGLTRDAEVFFSRRIGIEDGDEVPIIGGARAYGLIGSTNVGLMTMQTGESDGASGENFSVARVKQNVFGRSYFGGIFTSRRGRDGGEDTAFGGDFRLVFGVNTQLEASIARNSRNGVDAGNGFGTAAASQNVDGYDWSVRYTDIGESFDPGIGFVRRADQRRWQASARFKPRPGWQGVRQLSFGGEYARIENHRGELETELLSPALMLTLQSEDVVTLSYEDTFDSVPRLSHIGNGVPIPAGEYRNRQASLRFTSNASRMLAVTAAYGQGGYYDGDLRTSTLNVTFRPIPRIELRSQNVLDAVDVPGGSFDSLIARLYTSYYFNPRLTTRLGVQYSSLFDDLVMNFRVRWIYSPGSEAWIVYDEGRDLDVPGASLRDRAFIVKVVHNFNF
jgi:hypothetical protein